MSAKVKGGCLCGKVRFAVDNWFEQLYLCHCSQCRKITGSAFAAILLTQPDRLEWLAGEDNITRYEYPGRNFIKVFCRDCGSGLPYLNQQGTMLVVPAGGLDEEPQTKAQANIFCAEQPAWSEQGLAAESFATYPPQA